MILKKILFALICTFFTASTANAATINKIAAVVNGQMISYYDLQQAAMPEIKKQKLDVNKAAHKEKIEALQKKTLDNIILEKLISSEAEKLKITVSDTEVEEEISRIMQQSRLSKEAFEKQLEKEGLSIKFLRTRIYGTILHQKLMSMMVGRKVVVNQNEIQAYYNEHKSELKSSTDLQLALLIYPDSSNVRKHAEDIAKDTSKFEQIAREISEGPNKENGGFLGPVPKSKLEPALANLIASLKDGEVTPVITLNNKLAQFKVVKAASDGGPMTFEEAKPIIEKILREPKLKERFEEYISQLRSKAMIDIRI